MQVKRTLAKAPAFCLADVGRLRIALESLENQAEHLETPVFLVLKAQSQVIVKFECP